jgi:AcrR family transcriptional regulator
MFILVWMKPNRQGRDVVEPPREPAMARSGGKPAPARLTRPARSSDGTSAEPYKPPQRERLIDAMIELSGKGGYQQVSIAQLCSRAGVSSTTFYEQFADKEDCFLHAYRASAQRILGPMAEVMESGDWPEGARLALGRLFEALGSDPHAGRLLFIEALAGGGAIAAERGRVFERFERRAQELLERTSEDGKTLDVPVLAVRGALRHIVSRHLRTHAEDELPSLVGDGLAWLSSYAIPAETARWSTSAQALLEGAGAQVSSPAPGGSAPARLPPGRHGLPAGVIARSQHTRLIFGTAEVMMVKGYANTTVADIVGAAGVARPVFYEHFADKQQAFLEAQQYPTQFILDRCAEAYFSAKEWPTRMWRLLSTVIGLIVSNPAISHLRLVECYAAGPIAIRRAEEITRSFTIFIEEGYHYRGEAGSLPRLCSQAITGAIFEVVQQQIASGEVAALGARLPQLAYVAIAPFTGAQEAVGLVEEMRGRESSDLSTALADVRVATQS